MIARLQVVGLIPYLVQVDGSDLEPEDDDPQQTQDQCTVPVHHILWTNQIHPNLTGKTVIGLSLYGDSSTLKPPPETFSQFSNLVKTFGQNI